MRILWHTWPIAISSRSIWTLATGWWHGGRLRMCICWRQNRTTSRHGGFWPPRNAGAGALLLTVAPVCAWPALPAHLHGCFDLVAANHVLYYVPDLHGTLSALLRHG